ncbi:MAG TPA: GDP-L-fucose synthase [Candidatus Paceibacterota bacterium]
MNKDSKIYIAGHNGMVGSALKRNLEASGHTNIVCRSSKELDLRDQAAVLEFFKTEQPEYVFLAAAKVGGIIANNTYRADFIYENLMIQSNVIHATHLIHQADPEKGKKLMFLGSSCIYPKLAPQPLKEESLLTGPLEYTNEPYAVAKIAGIKMCESYRNQYGDNFISVMPTNLYGPNDNYDLQNSHVLPALIRKMHAAKISGAPAVELWGTGAPYREFMHVDDLASACVFLMNTYDGLDFVNIGVGEDITIKDLAHMVAEVVGYTGELAFDASKPDGTPRKLMDVSRLNALGWKHTIALRDGITSVYADVLEKGLLN